MARFSKNGIGKHHVMLAIDSIDGEFTAVDLNELMVKMFGEKSFHTSSFLGKFWQMRIINSRKFKSIMLHNQQRSVRVWEKTQNWCVKGESRDIKTTNCCDNWAQVWPEFFKQFPLPKGEIHREEM